MIFANPAVETSGYSVVHADGHILAHDYSSGLVASLAFLKELANIGPIPTDNRTVTEARTRYIDYLTNEYGYITLEGLPADQEVGSRSLRLENIFVPLSLEKIESNNISGAAPLDLFDNDTVGAAKIEEFDAEEIIATAESMPQVSVKSKKGFNRELVGQVLANNNRLAILGSPGAGKTTLLKRLAVAYANPERRGASNDHLPDSCMVSDSHSMQTSGN